jgi:hypothetical protein
MFAPAVAQDRTADYKIECKLFRKNTDGTWFLGAQTPVEVGPVRFTLAPGEIARGDIRFGIIDLHSILLSACGGIKAEPPQGFKSNKEGSK